MKSKIHPQYFENAQVTCACGHTFTTGSTKKLIAAETCHKCHPFYTGEHRYLDIKGRVDSFQKKQAAAKYYQTKKTAKKEKREGKKEYHSKTLRELLQEE